MKRKKARAKLAHYLEHDHHANLFLTWELKYPFDHPENVRIMKEFLDLLEKMEIVTSQAASEGKR